MRAIGSLGSSQVFRADRKSPWTGRSVTRSYHVERWKVRRQAWRRAVVHGLHLKSIPGLRRAVRALQWFFSTRRLVITFRRRRVARDLRCLHDTLAATSFGGRYWVWAGLLLGWAREKQILAHDLRDADFAYLAEDGSYLDAAIPALTAAGFRLVEDHRSPTGELVFQRFRKAITVYEFHALEPVNGSLRYEALWCDPDTHEHFELISEMPNQPLEHFAFLGRTWLKHADHEAELEAMYGCWRVPDPTYSYSDDGCIVERRRILDPFTKAEMNPASEDPQPH
jgi:hypothetical protein